MAYFGTFYLDKEKDIIVDLDLRDETLSYILRTPNHHTGNLITNLAKMCQMPVSFDENGLKVICGEIPGYIDGDNRKVYIFRMGQIKTANIYPDGTIERKASIPSISKTLMSQTKDYHLDHSKTILKTYIRSECKFRADLHTHMNANLEADVLIALGIFHDIRYPLYYIRKLGLKCSSRQQALLQKKRAVSAKQLEGSALTGKYLERKIDDHTWIGFADLILNNLKDAQYNIPRIRASLSVLKDGQAVFTNLEKVYLYRYVFTKGVQGGKGRFSERYDLIQDKEIRGFLRQMINDLEDPVYCKNTLFQNKLLWIARGYQKRGIAYAEISDTTLVKKDSALDTLKQIHEVMPAVYAETHVRLRFLAALRRIPLTIVKDHVTDQNYLTENLRVLASVMLDPYVAGSDIVGEEMNDILDLKPAIRELVKMAKEDSSFVIRIHAGENDSLRDNVYNSIRIVRESLEEGQKIPKIRIGHGLYTANLKSAKGRKQIHEILNANAVLEFQMTSNVRLNNLSSLYGHPLKQYLKAGIDCVQGTDGGALYGTDSIDEELALENLLELTYDELLQMRKAEEKIIQEGERAFCEKAENMRKILTEKSYEDWIRERYEAYADEIVLPDQNSDKIQSAEALKDLIREMPEDKMPVIIAGGSFNQTGHLTVLKKEICDVIDTLLEKADPNHIYFVIGHSLKGYEKYLAEQNRGRFELFSIVPSLIKESEKKKLAQYDCAVRVSIEPIGMGIYKSFAYEIFKRRPSVLLALDGNSPGANLIQEAKNGRKKCRILVNGHARALRTKAETLKGYAEIFERPSEVISTLCDIMDIRDK